MDRILYLLKEKLPHPCKSRCGMMIVVQKEKSYELKVCLPTSTKKDGTPKLYRWLPIHTTTKYSLGLCIANKNKQDHHIL